MVAIKNIILYDAHADVVGFVEVKFEQQKTSLSFGHNFAELGLTANIVADDKYMFSFDQGNIFVIRKYLDPDDGVFVSIQKDDKTLASGLINNASRPMSNTIHQESTDKFETKAAAEVDEVIRTMCNFDEDGVTACSECPYRKEFYEFKV